jgi:predicted Zn-dependent protease
LDKAEALMAETNLELAHAFISRAIERAPLLVAAHTLMGELAVQAGDYEQAIASLRTAIRLEPDSGAEKFMNLGQVLGGDEAADLYAQGVAILRRQLDAQPADVDVRRSLCSAYASIAELYLTDLCMADEAESECGAALQAALALDSSNVEALQLAASYNVSCQRPAEALELLQRSYALWMGAVTRAMADDGAELTDDDLLQLPTYERRLDAARLFMELSRPQEAVAICGLLVEEEDDIGEVWTLLANAHAAQNEWNDALECVERVELLCRAMLEKDKDLEAEVAALRARIEPHADAEGVDEDVAEDAGIDDDADADDDDDDDDDDDKA